MKRKLNVIKPGVIPYRDGLDFQMSLHAKRLKNEIPDTLILLQHNPVFTMGRRTDHSNLLKSEEFFRSQGIDVIPIDRGGDITYHGPGQITAYLIADLEHYGKSVKNYVNLLEETVITHLQNRYGLTAVRDEHHPGVWCGPRKICALGVGIKNKVTFHGIALNVNADLTPFSWIVPCGITGRGVTSLKQELDRDFSINEVMDNLADDFISICGYERGETSCG